MQKFIITTLTIIAIFIGACNKDDLKLEPKVGIAINQIEFKSFASSVWEHVVGGKVSINIKFPDGKTTTIDSTEIRNISHFKKTVIMGSYDVSIAHTSVGSTADTFLRFQAEMKNVLIEKEETLTIIPVIDDGLITIGKSFILEENVPTFKADGESLSYKLGLISGFYYIYVKGGTKGTLSFKSKTTKQVHAQVVNVMSLNHYNIITTANSVSAIEVSFGDFSYNEVTVPSTTLITIDILPFSLNANSKTFYLATDIEGNILTSHEYKGESTIKLASKEPEENERINVLQINIPANPTPFVTPHVMAYLQVPRGSVWSNKFDALPQKKVTSPLTFYFKANSVFQHMTFSTDMVGASFDFLMSTDTVQFNSQKFWYSEDSKIFVQVKKNNQVKYSFLDIKPDVHYYELDPNLAIIPSLSKTITSPGSRLEARVHGAPDKSYTMAYNLGYIRSNTSTLNFHYPNQTFQEYRTMLIFEKNNVIYLSTEVGNNIPTKAEGLETSYKGVGTTLADFKPAFEGQFDYFTAHFSNSPQTLIIRVASPSEAAIKSIKMPDLSPYLGGAKIDPGLFKLNTLGIHKTEGFKEGRFTYKNYGDFPYPRNSKSVEYSF